MIANLSNVNDSYFPTVAVAALDLLGVEALVSKADQGVSAMNVLSRFVRNASTRGVYNTESLVERHDVMYDFDVFFGDALYLFADPARDLETQVQWLLLRVATLVGLGLWSTPRFLVRGAIAVGDLRKRVAQGDNTPHEIRIGTSMITAHHLQEGQDWIGAAVDPGAPLNAEARKWTIACRVPLKVGCHLNGTPVAANWVWSNGTLEQVQRHVEQAVRETGPAEAAGSKLSNTLDLVRCVFETGQFSPFESPEG
jgi:hypothetical protein